ncbi:MAG: TIGR04002 family protein [Oscillospiraceae bacterium]|nr:TIGR04002 family protein [Oscillospiraceae bacterium]
MKIKTISISAFFSAVIFIFTAYLLHFPVGAGGAYLHFGDTFIYLAASFLPLPYAAAASAFGAGFADFACGFPVWIPFTVIIKTLMVLCFAGKDKKILRPARNKIAPVLAGIICIAGYYAAEGMISGSFIVPLESLPFNILQAAGSMIFYFVIGAVFDSRGLKERLL